MLCIREFDHFPHVAYAAVSYVWRGNDVPDGYRATEFAVKGAEEADPIGVDVLHDACVAAIARGADYLWIDRLAIMQTNKDDKHWQIREMYNMYRGCIICIVVAGGLRRLVTIDEETGWIHRGWTLQEALAPPSVVVLFAWKLGTRRAHTGDRHNEVHDVVEEVVPNRSAMTSLSLLLDACTAGYLSIEHGQSTRMVEAKLFSAQPLPHTYNDIPFWRPTRRVLLPNVSALALAMNADMDIDQKQYAIWESALMRTSKRPVDMAFSIMGLFGVSLDTRPFDDNDRIGATIALARQILLQGGRANWLGLSFQATPCPYISTFPTFPRTSVSGKALVRLEDGSYCEVSHFMESEYPVASALVPMPEATMDEDGYLTFDAKAVAVMAASPSNDAVTSQIGSQQHEASTPARLSATDGSNWTPCAEQEPHPPTPTIYAVLLGFFVGYFPGVSVAQNDKNVRAMLLEQHAPGRFHVRSYFMLGSHCRAWVRSWQQRTFCVGGPLRPGQHKDAEVQEDPQEVVHVDQALFANHPRSVRQPVTVMEMTARKARWAIPQQYLENNPDT